MHSTYAHLVELKSRTERATRRATLLASLGPLPQPERIMPFRRRVVALRRAVEVRRYQPAETPGLPRKAA